VTADEHTPPPPHGPLPGLETPFLDHEPSSGQRAEPWQGQLGELEAETSFRSALDLTWAQPAPGERERAEQPGGELASPGAFELEEAGIIDGDNRVRVKNTTGVPWRWICKIDVTDSRGRPAGGGTGLLISNRHVLTAAHVVHDAFQNMQQYTIMVVPALDDLNEPFGRYRLASKPRIRQEYDPTAADSLDWDYALLTLSSAVGEQRFRALNERPLCFWGNPHCGEGTMLARLDPRGLNGKAAYTAGYPGGKGHRQLWCAAGILHSANEKRRTMSTTADTTKGQSGSPVWVIDNRRYCLVGIAVGAGTGSNRAVRVTRELVRQLRAWITEGGETPAMVETEEALEPPVLLLPQLAAPPLDEQPLAQRFDPAAVPDDVAAALGKRDWPLALSLAIQAGWRDENDLTNLIFFARHPELPTEPLKRDNPDFGRLSAEWVKILNEEVWKAIEVSAENTDLVVSGKEVTDHHRAFFRGQAGRRLKKLVEDAAGETGLNPGLLGTIMMAETRRPLSYLSSEKVSSYHIGCDDFYEARAAIQARVPAYAKVKWDRTQTPVEHLNDAKKDPRKVKTILFDSGPDGALATAVYLKFREVRLREIAAELHGDFDSLPLSTRLALTRMAMAAGTDGATPYLKDALNGVDIFVREAIPVRAYQTKRNATVRTAQAMHLSDWLFGIPVPRAARPAGHELETWERAQDPMQHDIPGSEEPEETEAGEAALDELSFEAEDYPEPLAEELVPKVSGPDLRKRIDEYFDLANADYTLPSGGMVKARSQFNMASASSERDAEKLEELLKKKLGATVSGPLHTVIRCAAYGRARPDEIKVLTQHLIDAGKLDALRSRNPGFSNKQLVRALQSEFSIGIDCAGYVQLAFIYAFTRKHDDARCNLATSRLRQGLGLKAKRSDENLAALPSAHFTEVGFLNGRTGDLLVLAWRKDEHDWHTVIVVDHTIVNDIHTFLVDASWGRIYGPDAAGIQRREFVFDKKAGLWWDVIDGKKMEKSESTIGPYKGHPIKGMYRAKV